MYDWSWGIGVARILILGGVKPQKSNSSQSDLGLLIGGGRNVVGVQFRIGVGPKPQLILWRPKQKKRSSWIEGPILSQKLDKNQKTSFSRSDNKPTRDTEVTMIFFL